jgi:hypothetical protein
MGMNCFNVCALIIVHYLWPFDHSEKNHQILDHFSRILSASHNYHSKSNNFQNYYLVRCQESFNWVVFTMTCELLWVDMIRHWRCVVYYDMTGWDGVWYNGKLYIAQCMMWWHYLWSVYIIQLSCVHNDHLWVDMIRNRSWVVHYGMNMWAVVWHIEKYTGMCIL